MLISGSAVKFWVKKPLLSANKHPSLSLGPSPSPGCFPACRCLFLQDELGCGEGRIGWGHLHHSQAVAVPGWGCMGSVSLGREGLLSASQTPFGGTDVMLVPKSPCWPQLVPCVWEVVASRGASLSWLPCTCTQSLVAVPAL